MNRNVSGFSENPFNNTPDPMFLYLGASYRYAFLSLVQAIHERKGCIGLMGKPGTGKTTLINAAVAKLDQKTKTAFLSNFSTDIPFEQLLSAALVDMGATKSGETLSKMDAIDRLKEFAVKQLVSGGNVVLVVDEAQSLNRDVMLNLRLLSNLETSKHKLIQIILVGQTELKKMLTSPTSGQVNDRIAMWLELEALNRQELGHYITHRMAVAGGCGRVRFTKRALNTIHRYSQGIPRRINTVCDRALLIGYCKDESAVSISTVRRAIDDIRGPSRWDIGRLFKWGVGRLLKWDVGRLFKWREFFGGRAAKAAAVVLVVFLTVTVASWNRKERISDLFSAAGKAVFVQGDALEGNVVPLEFNTLPQEQYGSDDPLVSPEQAASIALDSRTSLDMLFWLFKENSDMTGQVIGEVYLDLYKYRGDPVLYRKFRKPFRLRITQQGTDQPSYLLIHSVSHAGAYALDSKGDMRLVTEDFILSHWDGEMSWVYPYEREDQKLTKGMSGPKVRWLQEMLRDSGFSVYSTGVLDSRTDDEIVRFQGETGLNATGVAGTQTKALLYQMSG